MDVAFGSLFYVAVIVFFIALCSCALFAFLETNITALRLFKLKELASRTGKYSLLFTTLENNPQRVLISILIARNFCDVTASALSSLIMERIFEQFNFSGGIGFSVGIALATIVLLLFGEIIPKNFAKSHGEQIFSRFIWLVNLIFLTLRPLVSVLLRFSDFLIYRSGGKKAVEEVSDWVSSEKEIQFLIEHINEKGLMETEKTEMLQNIFELGTTPVKEVMVPDTDIVSVEVNTTLKECVNIFIEYRYSRLPVYEGKIDNIVGMVYLKDIFLLLFDHQDKPLSELVRPLNFVPETVKVNQLLREFRESHQHMAIVINEYGSITGLVTLEDILEEIVGEISDEDEAGEEEKIVALKQGGWLVHAVTSLDELEKKLGITFQTEDVLTLGGFLTEQLQRLPKKGERVHYKNYYFQVQKASPKRVLQVLIFEDKNVQQD